MKFNIAMFTILELAFCGLTIYLAFQDKKVEAGLALIAANTYKILRKIEK